MIIQPGPVVDFLIANQNVRDPFSIDWTNVNFASLNFAIEFFWYENLLLILTVNM